LVMIIATLKIIITAHVFRPFVETHLTGGHSCRR